MVRTEVGPEWLSSAVHSGTAVTTATRTSIERGCAAAFPTTRSLGERR